MEQPNEAEIKLTIHKVPAYTRKANQAYRNKNRDKINAQRRALYHQKTQLKSV